MASYVSFAQKAINELLEKLAREINQIVEEAGTDFIDDTNSDLGAAKPGDTILSLLVTAHEPGRIELQYRKFLKYGFAKIRFSIADQLKYDDPFVEDVELRAILGDVRISKSGSYEVILGYGFDKGPPAYEAARGKIALKTPPISIDAFLSGSPDDGFVLDFGIGTGVSGSSEFPLVIPLGPSGFALQGIGGTFADNFRPNLAATSENGIEPQRPTAFDFVKWAQEQAMKPLDGWRPLRDNEGHVGGVGLRTDIIDLPTNGGLIRVRDAGFLALSDGPLVVHGGRGQLLSLPPDKFRFDLVSALDFNSLTYAMMGAASFKLPGESGDFELISADGTITAQISLRNGRDWFFNVGTDKAPIRGSFLKNVFSAQVFCMVSFDRIYVGSRVSFGGREMNFFGIKIDAYFGMETRAKLGFQPIHYEGSLVLFGGFGIRIWKFKLGIELSGIVAIAILKPFQLKLSVGWRINLPWPLSDISGTITLLNFEDITLADIAKPLLLQGATLVAGVFVENADQIRQKLGALHTLSGVQFDIDDETSSIWPDCELALPFYKKLTDGTGKILSPPISSYKEGGVLVHHRLNQLVLFRINETDGSEIEVPKLQGAWVVGPVGSDGDKSTSTARLHFPANDPFRWLDQFQDTSIETEALPPIGEEFDFGVGPAEFSVPRIDLPTIALTNLEPGMDLLSDTSLQLPLRVARISSASFEMQRTDGQPVGLLSRAVLTFASFDPEEFQSVASNRDLKVLSVVEQQVLNDRVLYFGRIEITEASGADFFDFNISFQRSVECVGGVYATDERCRATIALYRVTLFSAAKITTSVEEKAILQPGVYRIAAEGKSTWSARGKGKDGTWGYSQKFRVTYPPTITPYVAYVTIGDERPYHLLGQRIWNPTPSGLGFPSYKGSKSSVVFRPDYFSKIYSELVLEFIEGQSVVVPVTRSQIGERFESASSAKWLLDAGGQYGTAEELLFDAPIEQGVYELNVSFANALTGENFKLDSWSFERSGFFDVVGHLALAERYVRISRSTVAEVKAVGGSEVSDLDQSVVTEVPVPAISVPASWRLPPTYEPQHKRFEEQSALSFLRFVERSRIPISAVNGDPLYGIAERPDSTTIEAFTDRNGKPFCFWLRTPEPLDWRRLSAQLVVYATAKDPGGKDVLPNVAPLPLDVLFTPSPDGTAALLFARAGETYVRLPKGLYILNCSYSLKTDGLPHLRLKSNTMQESQEFEVKFYSEFGEAFSGVLN